MSKKAPSPPPPPDPVATANAQADANIRAAEESAKRSAIDIYSPFGSTTYAKDANGLPISQTTTLSPGAQGVFDDQIWIGNNLSDTAINRLASLPQSSYSLSNQPYAPGSYDTSQMPVFDQNAVGNLPYDPRAYGDISLFADKYGDAVWNQGKRRLDPYYQQQDERFEQMMNDRGLPMTGEAYTRTRAEFDRNRDNAYLDLNDRATQAELAASQQMLGMEQGLRNAALTEDMSTSQRAMQDWLQRLQVEQNLRNQGIADYDRERMQGINEVSAILQGSPALGVPQAPNAPTYNIAPGDIQGATYASYNGQLQNYQAKQAQNASMWNGAMGLAGAAMPFIFSHPSLKVILADA